MLFKRYISGMFPWDSYNCIYIATLPVFLVCEAIGALAYTKKRPKHGRTQRPCLPWLYEPD